MSANVKILPGLSARSSVAYSLFGRGEQNAKHVAKGTDRAAGYFCTMDTPEAFVEYAENLSASRRRKYEVYNLILSFDPKEMDPGVAGNVTKVTEIASQLASAAYASEHMVVVHDDADGGHLHAHITVINHDELTGKALSKNTSWVHGLRQLNDEILAENGLQPNPNPEVTKPGWELRREQFTPDGFEQKLGDLVAESLLDDRSVDQEHYEAVLAEHGIRLRVTNRDGWSYSMRREDNGKWGRKKASALTPEFTREGAQEIFEINKQASNMKDENNEFSRSEKTASSSTAGKTRDLGEIKELRISAPIFDATPREPGEIFERAGLGSGVGERSDGGVTGEASVDLSKTRKRLREHKVGRENTRNRAKPTGDSRDSESDRRKLEQERIRAAQRRQRDQEIRRRRFDYDEESFNDTREDDFELE